MPRLIFLVSLVPAVVFAHEGHGMEGVSHYHATNAWGFLAAVAVGVVVWWMGRDQ